MFRTGLNRGADAVPLTERLPWAYFAERGIVFLKFGGFQRTLRFRGGDAASMGEAELNGVMNRLHDALRRVRGQMSLHIEARRVPASAYPGADLPDQERRKAWPDPVSFLFDEERRDAYDAVGSHFETERFITFVWRCSKASTRRARSLFVTGQTRQGKEGSRELHEFLQAADTVKGMLDGVMKECGWLDDDETLNFLHKTVSTNSHRVKPSYGKSRIDYDVADCRVVGGAEPVLGNCHMRVISLKNAPDTLPAALAALDTLPFEHRYTLRWQGMEHGEGLRHIEKQLRDWKMLGIAMIPMLISYMLKSDKQKENQAANAMAEDAVEALHAARRDDLTIGHANINAVIWDRDLLNLDRKIQVVTDIMQRLGLTVTSYSVAPIDTWLGTIPGHIYADLRRPVRTSINLSHFAPYSSVWSGETHNAHLNGAPLLIATTDGSTRSGSTCTPKATWDIPCCWGHPAPARQHCSTL
jgi:type IV secretion system protein TrbE